MRRQLQSCTTMSRKSESGFSLIELLIAILILGIVTGGIFSQLNTAQQRVSTEQTKVDNFDEARDFVDQFFRDINQIGYPNGRMVSFTPHAYDSRVAYGLIKIDSNSIWFEGDINGSGVVQEVQYMIDGSGSTSCTLCFQRSAIAKVDGNDYTTYSNGNAVTALPADITNNAAIIASIKTIHINLQIQNSSVLDPQTKQPIQTNFEGEVSLNNCSMATTGSPPQTCQ